jgi:hypothetical protein
MMPGGLVMFKDMNQLLACSASDRTDADATRSTRSNGMSTNAGERRANVPAAAQPLDYYSILLEAIDKTKQNPAQLRALVYERARFNFKRDVLFGHSSMGLADLVQKIDEFELAVARIEATAIDDQPRPAYQEQPQPDYQEQPQPAYREQQEPPDPAATVASGTAVQILPPRPLASMHAGLASLQAVQEFWRERRPQDVWPPYVRPTQFLRLALVGLVLLGAAIAGSVLWRVYKVPAPIEVADKAPQTAEAAAKDGGQNNHGAATDEKKSSESAIPLPTSFGIYVLSDKNLTELQPLPISVPGPRVAVSGLIKSPSTTTVTDGKPSFILFRRDLLNSAPQKITLRVIARMARETKIVNGKATVANIEGEWRIRNISRDLRLSPIEGQREMLMARLDDGVSLTPGRYALVLNQVGYDFTVAGATQSADFCLEEFETTNGTMLNKCRTP